MHGGAGSGAPKGHKNGSYKHGRHSIDAKALRQRLNHYAKLLKSLKV
jgi:hypothetical protein